MFFQHRLFQGATRSPKAARPRQVPPTQQPSRSPAKERASQANSASEDFSKLPSQNGWNSTLQAPWYIRHVRIMCFLWTKPTMWLLILSFTQNIGGSLRALDSGQAERQFKSPCLRFFFLLFFSAVPGTWVQIPLSLLFCFFFSVVLLLYCYTHMVGSWVVGGGWVFLLCTVCALLLYNVLLYCCSTGWVVGGWIGSWVCPWVRVFVFVFFSRNTAPRWHSPAYR